MLHTRRRRSAPTILPAKDLTGTGGLASRRPGVYRPNLRLDAFRGQAYAWPMSTAGDEFMPDRPTQRHARLFRNGRNQALRIPREFELPGDEVIIRKEDDRLIVEPVKKPNTLAELLASWEPLEEEFPDVDDGLLPLDDVKL